MRQKFITALSLSILFSVVFGLQIASTAKAETKNGNPLTSPVTFFQISGNVTYKFFKMFGHDMRRFNPAAGVTVSAVNLMTHDTYQTTTDTHGNYSLSVEEKGLYVVNPSGGKASTYFPPTRFVSANKKGGMRDDVDFQGLVF